MRIVIVGSGPAGASAAYHLASSGHHATLLDRSAFPRDKTCGDWVTPAAVRALRAMRLFPERLRSLGPDSAAVRGSLLAAPNGRSSQIVDAQESFCIPRIVFDDVLRRRAIDAGARFIQRDVKERDLSLLSREFDRVVDARGAAAGRTNSAGLRAYWTLSSEDVPADMRATVQLFADREYRLGYGWIFPVSAAPDRVRFNVGVGAAKAECRKKGQSLPVFFDRFVRQHPAVRWMADRAVEQTRPAGFPVALAERRRPVSRLGVLKIGDAANLTDPLTGEGIAAAITSGELVARAICESRDAVDAAAAWQRTYEEVYAPDFRIALGLRHLLTPTIAKNVSMWALGYAPSIARRLHDALSGTRPYRDLLPFSF
jgi:geranylgeranyl reductase family protein